MAAAPPIDFRTSKDRYRHWTLSIDGPVATLCLSVDEKGGIRPGYDLKLNSYDLGVDIELYDATQRLRFEHPEVGAVVLASARDRIFCAGANIRMLAQSSHAWKVNFCKFTNETRFGIEDASDHSHQRWLCAINGTSAGGGYELALSCETILMVDDGNTAVSLPEVPLLAVLPGTGGLTRLVDKRHVRRDRADTFCTTEEGIKGRRAVEWGLVDEVVPASVFADRVRQRALELAATTDRPTGEAGIQWTPLSRAIDGDHIVYDSLEVVLDRARGTATLTVLGPTADPPDDVATVHAQGVGFWPLALARALDDAILHLRTNEPDLGVWVLQSRGDLHRVAAFDALLDRLAGNWLVREVRLYWKRVLKRLDVTSRSLFALVTPGSCFAGFLLELVLAADRSWMLEGTFEGQTGEPAGLMISASNFGPHPMPNGLSRLATRFLGSGALLDQAARAVGRVLGASEAAALGVVTFAPDDIDWADEVRIAIEERASLSPDALTGMEASLRFAGPETLETKVYGRLSAWQNWVFQRPNAVGDGGALKLYGTGRRAAFHRERV